MSAAQSAAATAAAASAVLKYPRVLTLDVVVALNAVQTPAILSVPGDADFEWWLLSIQRTDPRMQVLFEDTGSAGLKIIYNAIQPAGATFNGVFIDNLAGQVAANGALPLGVPYVMPANRRYQLAFTDTSGAQNTVEMAFHGYALLAVPAS
jgi:hypothetical protein